ncbi:MAG: glycerol-3-phosphate 1-O-acyltransferase PlsY [Candidatus Margulisiibacteriota bacterium]|jgi:glycerol-3-phosphate acyltransferase PlsY
MSFLLIPLCYLLGSIPFSYLIARLWRVDLRQVGSGNVGATNVLRSVGPWPGALAFLLDFLKGWLAVYLAFLVGGDPIFVLSLGLAVIIGHTYPIFLGFRGGKGAATGLGVLAGIAPEIFALALIFALAIIALTRYVSVASILTPWLVAALMYYWQKPIPYLLMTLLVAVFIFVRHVPNIKRLRSGTELRLGSK